MEVRITDIEYFRELYVRADTEGYRVLSSSLEAWEDRLILQVELTKGGVEDAGKDNKAPVAHRGLPSMCPCLVCRASRERASNPVKFHGES